METLVDTELSLPLSGQTPTVSPILPLSEAPDGTLSVPPSVGVAPDAVRLLVVDQSSSTEAARGALEFRRDDHRRWLARAAAQNSSLVVVQTADRLELYSTEEGHRRAFRAVVELLSERALDNPELGLTPTLELGGESAVRHLLRRAGGLETENIGDSQALGQIHAAAAVSSARGALGPELTLLFRAAAAIGRRVRQETALGDPDGSLALRDIEEFAAERILEEEFTVWQRAASDLRRTRAKESLAPAVARSFIVQEPSSFVRVRVPRRLVNTGDS